MADKARIILVLRLLLVLSLNIMIPPLQVLGPVVGFLLAHKDQEILPSQSRLIPEVQEVIQMSQHRGHLSM